MLWNTLNFMDGIHVCRLCRILAKTTLKPIDANETRIGQSTYPCMVVVCIFAYSFTHAQLDRLASQKNTYITHIHTIQNPLKWQRKRNKQNTHNNIISLMIYVIPLERQAKTIVSSHSAKLWFGWLCVVFGFSLWSFCKISLFLSYSVMVWLRTENVFIHAKLFEFATRLSHSRQLNFRLCLQPTDIRQQRRWWWRRSRVVLLYACMAWSDWMFASVERAKTSTFVYWLTVSIVYIALEYNISYRNKYVEQISFLRRFNPNGKKVNTYFYTHFDVLLGWLWFNVLLENPIAPRSKNAPHIHTHISKMKT